MESPTSPAWTFSPPERVAVRSAPGDRVLTALGVILLGYALMGRGFAYLGVPPLFVGEIVLAAGLGVVLLARRMPPLAPALPMWILGILLAWVTLRVAVGVPTYGLDAVRDGMIVGYGLYAFVVAGLVMERPERLRVLLERYRVLATVLLLVGWAVYLVVRIAPESIPIWPWTADVLVVESKAGDLLVHFATVTAFLLLGWKRATPWWLGLAVLGSAVLMVSNRGGMLAFLLSMGLFWLLKPKTARFGKIAYVGAVLVLVGLAVDTSGLETNEGSRSISVEQIWENVASVFGKSDSRALNDTAEWRLQWWSKIVGYTFGGEYFFDGKGFGLNLATDDKFRVDEEESLRSPHNGHLTLLARGGVPTFLLWLLLQGLWFREVLGAWARARRAGHVAWVGFFALCATFWLAALVNASFDVYLEGPMGGIWFWTVFGLAMAGTRLQRSHPHLLDGLAEPVETPSAPRFGW